MAKLNEIRFFLLVSLMIFPAWALDVFLANAEGTYNTHTCVEFDTSDNGERTYRKCPHVKYDAKKRTFYVILHVVSPTRLNDIMSSDYDDARRLLSLSLDRNSYELILLAMNDFDEQLDKAVIRDFIRDTIKPFHNHKIHFTTIGDINLEEIIEKPEGPSLTDFGEYKENRDICKKELRLHLKLIGPPLPKKKSSLCGQKKR